MANVRPSLGHLCTSHSSASVVVGAAPKLLGKTLRILCIPPRAQNADQTCWLDTQRRQYSSADKIMRVYTIHFSKCWETHLPLSTHIAFSNGISMGPDSHFQMQDKIKVRRLRLSKMCSILSSHSKFWNVLIKHLAFFFFFNFPHRARPGVSVGGARHRLEHKCVLLYPWRGLTGHRASRD